MSEIKVEIPCSFCDPEVLIENIKIKFHSTGGYLEISGECPRCRAVMDFPVKIGVPVGSAVLK